MDRTIRIKVDSSGAERDVDSLDNSMKGLGASADKTDKSFGKLKATVIAVAAALQVRVVAQYADAFTSLQNQIRQTTVTTEQLTSRTATLLEVANRSRAGFTETADLYTQLTLSTENLNLTTAEQIRLTETISKSFAISGKSAAESAGAIRQLGQAFGSGALRGDEFNSIAEGAPELMRALQRSLKLTAGELREFAATGGITAEIMVNAFTDAADVIDEKMINSVETLAQSMVIAENNAIAFVGASDLVTTSMGAAGESIVFLSENLDVIANVLLVAAIAGLSRLTSAFIVNSIQVVRSTTVMGAATIATTSLSRAVAVLGGPLGVVLLAASSIAVFASDAGDAAAPTEELSKQVDSLSESFRGLSDQARFAATANNTVKIISLNKELAVTIRNLATAFGVAPDKAIPQGTLAIINQNEAVIGLIGSIRNLEVANEALFKAGIDKALVGATDQSGASAEGKTAEKEDDPFINNERFKTDSLRAQLIERQEIQRAFNSAALADLSTTFNQERAMVELNRQISLAELETRRTDSELDFEQRREAILANEKLTSEAKLALNAELELQELDQKSIFELAKTDIEREGAEERKLINADEAEFKANAQVQASDIAIQANRSSQDMILGFLSQFAGKSKGMAVALVALRAAQAASEIVIDTQRGSMLAVAQLGIFSGPAVAAIQAQGAIALGIVGANAALKIGAATSGGSGGSASGLSGASSQTQAPRQEPIQQQNVVEIRGLAEVAELLANLDPDEVLPVEYTQRIVASLDEFSRISGEAG